jgi:hypothetical protein
VTPHAKKAAQSNRPRIRMTPVPVIVTPPVPAAVLFNPNSRLKGRLLERLG